MAISDPGRGEPQRAGRLGALQAGLLIGVGLAGTLDEVVLHQLLGWHHFFDRMGPSLGRISDGIFHVATTTALAGGVYALARRGQAGGREVRRRAWAGIFLGAGGFNLYDGTVQHKLLRLHKIRPQAPDQLPYDLVFNAVALAALAIGWLLLRRSNREARGSAPRRS